MSHPLMYVLGDTEIKDFPLVLTIGREPNYDDVLTDEIGQIDISEFSSMSGGVWVTAYTQFAKQYFGQEATSGKLKDVCLEKNASPIVFTNAFPMGIPQSVGNKDAIREKLADAIPSHISNLFSKSLISRVKLVVHHGVREAEMDRLAAGLIKEQCVRLDIPYCSSAFFYNGNSAQIQSDLKPQSEIIRNVFNSFCGRA